MPRREMVMPLAFSASQRLDLPVEQIAEHLADYLQQEERVIAALLDERQLTKLLPRHLSLHRDHPAGLSTAGETGGLSPGSDGSGSIQMRALDCELDGLGIVQDFSLTLDATLICDEHGLSGDARLDVSVSQPRCSS